MTITTQAPRLRRLCSGPRADPAQQKAKVVKAGATGSIRDLPRSSLLRTRKRLYEWAAQGAEQFAAALDAGMCDVDPTLEEAEYRCDPRRWSASCAREEAAARADGLPHAGRVLDEGAVDDHARLLEREVACPSCLLQLLERADEAALRACLPGHFDHRPESWLGGCAGTSAMLRWPSTPLVTVRWGGSRCPARL